MVFSLGRRWTVTVQDQDLSRFTAAQRDVYPRVLVELRACRKASHWMWFVFPQIAGLGRSEMAMRFAIADAAEAAAYLDDPLLGARLREVTALMLACDGVSATGVLGSPDDLKFRSSLTLFGAVATSPADRELFKAALARFFGGAPDSATLTILEAQGRR
jgi:uncharacterized protein (DUF1810 family)